MALSLLLLAHCDGSPGLDGGAETDAGSVDAALPDAALLDAGPLDAGPDAGMDAAGSLSSGVVTYDRRPISSAGLGAATPDPVGGATVVLIADGLEVARAQTDADGRYSFVEEPSGEVQVRVLADSARPPIAVTDFAGNVYAFSGGVGALHITEPDFAGALALLDTQRDGLRFAAEAFSRAAEFPPLEIRWERGRTTPGGTSYATGDELWILGGPTDTDEYDTPVLLHELGHYLQWVYEFSDVPDGDPHAGADTDPRLAWNEGWPSFFSAAARGDGSYRDSVGGVTAIDLDLGSLPFSGEYVGRASAPMSQRLSEWLIAGSLYHLYTSGDLTTQRARSFAPLTQWLDDPGHDRGAFGRDFVDFLDGYLCVSSGADRARIEQHVVRDRRFPYDLSPTCPKPGTPRLEQSIDPPRVFLPGTVLRDQRGRSLRVIQIAR
ncbi:MAG TPA: carboxypeptidase regulatory-like domain-containing protein [Polyangiaceae bacterium]|nr:carboxypeptidase regulatory-like domain-containing protein [Polyangiaceae bacterium]